MQFRDGQLLTAEDINKYLVNREGSLDTSAQTANNTEYASAIQAAQTRIDAIGGTVINFPGYSTNIIEIPLTYYQSPTHAGNATGTEGWREIGDQIKAGARPFVFDDSFDIIKFSVNKAKMKRVDGLTLTFPRIYQNKPMEISKIKQPYDNSGWREYVYGEYKYYKYTSFNDIFPFENERVFYTAEPLSSTASVFDFYALGNYDKDNLPLVLAEVTV